MTAVAKLLAEAPAKCPHCKGPMRVTGGLARCSSCGRESLAASRNVGFSDVAPGSAPRPCRVDGCPGMLDASGHCPCCAVRATWELSHAPKRECQLCGGTLTGRIRKFCKPCAAARVRVGAKAAKVATKTKSGASQS